MAAITVNGIGGVIAEHRPLLVSRHSSHLPSRRKQLQTKQKALTRRCRSVSPPVKKREILSRLSECSDHSHEGYTHNMRRTLTEINPNQTHIELMDTQSYGLNNNNHWPSLNSQLKQTKPSYGSQRALPDELSVKVLSYLSIPDRGKCMLVCKDWYRLVHTPSLWTNINLREFEWDARVNRSYTRYITRIEQFVSFLIDCKFPIYRLSFSFDLLTCNWLGTVTRLVMYCETRRLKFVDIDWRYSPYQQGHTELNINDLVYASKRRRRKFLDLLELLVAEAPNIETFIMPFDWGQRSAGYLSKLKKIRNLALDKYMLLQTNYSSELLERVVNVLPNLERFVLQICCSTSRNQPYSLHSGSLVYLDLSRCSNFIIGELNTPRLETIRLPMVEKSKIRAVGTSSPANCLVDIIRNLPHVQEVNKRPIIGPNRGCIIREIVEPHCVCPRHIGLF